MQNHQKTIQVVFYCVVLTALLLGGYLPKNPVSPALAQAGTSSQNPPKIYLPLLISSPEGQAFLSPTQPPSPAPTAVPTTHPTQPAGSEAVLVGAGDIARCNVNGDEQTAALIQGISGTVMAIGDTAYDSGTAAQYSDCYNPSWGAFKARTRSAVGNHEYMTSGASAYQAYFGSAAGPAGKFYYSYDLGAWHIVVLNSECGNVPGGCSAGSPQETWLKADLSAHPNQCTLAYWHEPRYSSGEHGNNSGVNPFWQDLYAAGAELVLNGHDHDYERFAPLNPSGKPDGARGLREIVVGTGGGNLRAFSSPQPNSLVRIANTYGVLKLTLKSGSYDWQFIAADRSVKDSGSDTCH